MGLTWDGRVLMQSGKNCQKPVRKMKKTPCFSPVAIAGRTKQTAKPFKGREGRREGNRERLDDGENAVQIQVL